MSGRKAPAGSRSGIPGDSLYISFSGSGEPRLSPPLKEFLAVESLPAELLEGSLSEIPEGAWPVILGGKILLGVMVRFKADSGILFLRPSSREDLCRFLDTCYCGDRMLLCDVSGSVLASSSCFEAGSAARTVGEVLEPSSALALQAALSEGTSGGEIDAFAVSEAGSGRQYILEPSILSCPGTPVLLRFSDPSLGIEGTERESEATFDKLFMGIPLPVIAFDGRGVITHGNDAARLLWRDMLGREIESSLFFECLSPEDRTEALSLHERISTAVTSAPVSFRAGLCSIDGRIIPGEITAAGLPETGEAVATIVPSAFPADTGFGDGHTVSALLSALDARPGDDDLFRWVLELVRAGTGARGASCRLEGRTITVGDIQLEEEDGDEGDDRRSGPDSITVQVKHRQGILGIRLSGLGFTELSPGQQLVLRLASLFADYSYGMESVGRIMKMFSAIGDFRDILSQQNGGLDGILKRTAGITDSDAILVSALREGESGLVPLAGFGYSGELPVLSLDADTVASWAYTHGELTYMADSVRDSRFETVCPGMGSELAVPLLREGRTVATLTASCRHQGGYAKPLPSLLRMMGTVISLWLYGGSAHHDHLRRADRGGNRMDRARTDSLLLSLSRRLRSPMSAISANLDLLREGGPGELTREQTECLESMLRSLTDLRDQCERILAFMRLEVHEESGESVWADPSGLVSSLMPALTERGARRKVSVKADLPEDPFLACFDPSCMEQIVSNLVDNAIAFNMPGGDVTVRIARDDEVWTLEVSDTGRGITPAELPRIFDGFRSAGGAAGQDAGLGLGLAIVKRFTELQGGVISVWSNEKNGTRFILRFPVSG